MAQKLKQIVSTLALDVKALNLDDKISFRYLADKFKDKIAYFLRLESRSREFTKDLSIWKPIHCIKLIDVPTNYCGLIDGCKTLKRSEVKIPEAYNTPYGLLIKILTVDGSVKFDMILSNQEKDYRNFKYGGPKHLCWLEDGYIFVPNTEVEQIKVLIIPKEPIMVDAINDCKKCIFPLEGEVNYSDYLITLAKQEVLKELYPGKQIVQDEKGDDNTLNKQ